MNKAIIVVAIAVVAAVGISAFALMSSNTGEIASVVQESVILEEKVSVLDTNSFSSLAFHYANWMLCISASCAANHDKRHPDDNRLHACVPLKQLRNMVKSMFYTKIQLMKKLTFS